MEDRVLMITKNGVLKLTSKYKEMRLIPHSKVGKLINQKHIWLFTRKLENSKRISMLYEFVFSSI